MRRALFFACVLFSAGILAGEEETEPIISTKDVKHSRAADAEEENGHSKSITQDEIEMLKRLREEERVKRQQEFEKMPKDKIRKTSSGLEFIEVQEGTGRFPERGQKVQVRYKGWLLNGSMFDSSEEGTYEFPVGYDRVIAGWDEGVAGMKVGGKRRLIIPSRLGYGAQGKGRAVPPNSTLIFDVELVKIADGK